MIDRNQRDSRPKNNRDTSGWKRYGILLLIVVIAVTLGVLLFGLQDETQKDDSQIRAIRLLGYVLVLVGAVVFLSMKERGATIDLKFVQIPDNTLGVLVLIAGCVLIFLPHAVSDRFLGGAPPSESLEDRLEKRFKKVLKEGQMMFPFNFTGDPSKQVACASDLVLIRRNDLPGCVSDIGNRTDPQKIELLARYFADGREEESFAEWVDRAAPMVVVEECDTNDEVYKAVKQWV